MDPLFRFPGALRSDPAVEEWFAQPDPLCALVQPWFARLRACSPDTRELIHDRRPTVCAGDAAFAYVDAHAEHATIGFFFGALLDDPAGLLEGVGKRMRHVKLRFGKMPIDVALRDLIIAAYADAQERISAAQA
jgi:hypothetical protein